MIDVTKLKNRWLGEWEPQYRYVKNDVIQWKGSTYVCLRDIPLEYISVMDNSVNTNNYHAFAPSIFLKTKDPTDTTFWLLFAPGTNFKDQWAPFRRYEKGDIVDLYGDIYVCTANTYTPYNTNTPSYIAKNTYPTDTNYWTLMFQAADRDRRNMAVQTWNQQPLGWTRNGGGGRYHTGESSGPSNRFGYIDVEGTPNIGGYKSQGTGTGSASNGYTSYGWYQTAFLYTGWQDSTQNGGTGRLTTPDGEAPKCVQWLYTNDDYSIWLMNNGEVYTSGFNSQGQLGNLTTSTYSHPVRSYATDTTDWLGNTIPYTFANSKIIKVAVSSMGSSSAPSVFALDDIGQVWAWGYNAYGQLGFGSDNTATGSFGNMRTDQTRPRCIPRSHFGGKKIVDIYSQGSDQAAQFAIDEDGGLWAWGCEGWGELGLGQRSGSPSSGYSFYHTPRQVPVDFNQYGGIQKIFMCFYGASSYRFTMILDGEGKIWLGGYQPNNSGAANMWSNVTGANGLYSGKFIRLNKGWWRDHDIENFWLVGDAYTWTMYIREKATGITYSCGNNVAGILGHQSNSNYWKQSGGFKIEPGRVEGVHNLVDAWNNQEGQTSSDTSSSYQTVVLLTENGECWGQGLNPYGSLGLGYAGQSYLPTQFNETYQHTNLFQKIPAPDGYNSQFIGGLGWGNSTYDGGMYLTNSGRCMIAGTDGSTYHTTYQGHYWTLRYYQSAIANPGAYHRYHIHGYPGG
jgi:alpha-tubulin suppressor-like RCC1 family protein